ncbi:MAG: hypothetical protein GVY11_01305 [Gammaproteobacteria bacterium]|jgi:hypothetical protein|nr:hypothetical protein [Gammaproteobacteria bacterium]
MEKAGLFVADQLAARIGHGAMVALGDITCRPENRLPSRKKFPTNRGCPGFSWIFLRETTRNQDTHELSGVAQIVGVLDFWIFKSWVSWIFGFSAVPRPWCMTAGDIPIDGDRQWDAT